MLQCCKRATKGGSASMTVGSSSGTPSAETQSALRAAHAMQDCYTPPSCEALPLPLQMVVVQLTCALMSGRSCRHCVCTFHFSGTKQTMCQSTCGWMTGLPSLLSQNGFSTRSGPTPHQRALSIESKILCHSQHGKSGIAMNKKS